MKQYTVYILTNKRKTVLYVGVTSNLSERLNQHKTKSVKGFTEKYNTNILVYYETYEIALEAISREKQIKAGSRKKKEELINKINPKWEDLILKFDRGE